MKRKRLKNKLAVVVNQDIIEETTSEKLQGVVVNNQLTWKEHLYGDNENEGLITQLKKRVGTLKRLAKYMSKKRLSMLLGGIFYSKLVYCLAVIGNVNGMLKYRESTRMAGMTADDCNKLQVIKNSLNRLLTGARKGTPTKDLLERTGTFQTCRWWHTIQKKQQRLIQTGKPSISPITGGSERI